MTDFTSDWPEDADGDVFHRLREHGFDFTQHYAVDYNVDFDAWPPSADAVAWLEREFGQVGLYPPGEDLGGYAEFQVVGPLTYDGVTSIQRRVSAAMERFGGICESWGVLQAP
jgi:hypothetical protein